jgi:hypothetical protein
MQNTVKIWLTTTIRFRQDTKSFLNFVLFFCLYLVLFLGLYKPFFLQALNSYDLWSIVIRISLFTALLLLASYIIISRFFTAQIENWTIGYEISWVIFHFLIIGAYNSFLFRQFNALSEISTTTFFLATILVGIIPAFFDAGFRFYQPKNKKAVLSNVLYVKSDGNYIHIFKSESGGVQRDIQRTPLVNFHKNHESELIQVHKSFLVNSDLIKNVKGNSNGGKITLVNDLSIPYSRGFYENIKSLTS